MAIPESITGCPGCHAELSEPPLVLLDGRLVGPIATLRVRSTSGERSQRVLLITCSNCGLVSQYDADWVQAEMESTEVTSG